MSIGQDHTFGFFDNTFFGLPAADRTGLVCTLSVEYEIDNLSRFNSALITDSEGNTRIPIYGETSEYGVYWDDNEDQQHGQVRFIRPILQFAEEYTVSYEFDAAVPADWVTANKPADATVTDGDEYTIDPTYNDWNYEVNGTKYVVKEWEIKVGTADATTVGKEDTANQKATVTANTVIKPIFDTSTIVDPDPDSWYVQFTYAIRNKAPYLDSEGVKTFTIDETKVAKVIEKVDNKSIKVAIKKADVENDTTVDFSVANPTVTLVPDTDKVKWTRLDGYYEDQDGTAYTDTQVGDDGFVYIYLQKEDVNGPYPPIDSREIGNVDVNYPGEPYNGLVDTAENVPIGGPYEVYMPGDPDGQPSITGNATPVSAGDDTTNPPTPAKGKIDLPLDQIPEKDDNRNPIDEIKVEVVDPDPAVEGDEKIKVTVTYKDNVDTEPVTTDVPVIDDVDPDNPNPDEPTTGPFNLESGAVVVFVGGDDKLIPGSMVFVVEKQQPTDELKITNDYFEAAKVESYEGRAFTNWKLEGNKTDKKAFDDPNEYVKGTAFEADYYNTPYYVMRAMFAEDINVTVTKENQTDPIIDDKPITPGTIIRVVDPEAPADNPHKALEDGEGNPYEYVVDGPDDIQIPASIDDDVPPLNEDGQVYTGELKADDKDNDGNPDVVTDNGGNEYVPVRPQYADPEEDDIIVDPVDPVDPTDPDDPNKDTYGVDADGNGYVILSGNLPYKGKTEKVARVYYNIKATVNGKEVAVEGEKNEARLTDPKAIRTKGFETRKTLGYFGALASNEFTWDEDMKAYYIDFNMEHSGIIEISATAKFGNTTKALDKKWYVIMVGDADKTGLINASDILAVNRMIKSSDFMPEKADDESLKGGLCEYKFEISDVDKTKRINASDILAINRMIKNPDLCN